MGGNGAEGASYSTLLRDMTVHLSEKKIKLSQSDLCVCVCVCVCVW